MATNPHSDLEVVSQDTHKYPYYSPDPIPAYPSTGTDTNKIAYVTYEDQTPNTNTICGLRKRTIWIAVIAAVVVVAAAIGGGVGGALASRKSSNATTSPDSSSTSAAQSTPGVSSSAQNPTASSTPTSSTPSLSTATLTGPTSSPLSTILRDCPSSNNTVYTVAYGSTTQQYRKLCSNAYLNVNGVDNVIGVVVASLDECINRCTAYNINNQTDIEAGRDRICNAVCWRNTFDEANDWPGGMCFGYTTQNTTVEGGTAFRVGSKAERICDSAALMNQNL